MMKILAVGFHRDIELLKKILKGKREVVGVQCAADVDTQKYGIIRDVEQIMLLPHHETLPEYSMIVVNLGTYYATIPRGKRSFTDREMYGYSEEPVPSSQPLQEVHESQEDSPDNFTANGKSYY
jgi:hypothetical protein